MPYYLLGLCCLAVRVIFDLLTKITSNNSLADSIIIGLVIFLCFLGIFSFGYFLIKNALKTKPKRISHKS